MKIKDYIIRSVLGRFTRRCALHVRIDKQSSVGAYTYIGENVCITKSNIGRYCSIANNVSIGQGEHDLCAISTSSLFYEKEYEILTQKECIIKNDVWIGVSSIIRRGVTIGNGAVIGANSFVNTDIPDFSVACGTPAKIIKYRFTKEFIEKINSTAWWNCELNEAKNIIRTLTESIPS